MTNLQIYRGWVFVHLKIKKSYELVNNNLSLEKIHLCMYKKVLVVTGMRCVQDVHTHTYTPCVVPTTPHPTTRTRTYTARHAPGTHTPSNAKTHKIKMWWMLLRTCSNFSPLLSKKSLTWLKLDINKLKKH